MIENEAIKFIGQAVIESGKVLEKLQNIKSEAERIGEIGEYYAHLDNCVKEIEACKVAMIALTDIQAYRAIGTVEELKDLKEKSVAKKAIRLDDNDEYYDYQCPSCGAKEKFCLRHRYCSCGQLLEY